MDDPGHSHKVGQELAHPSCVQLVALAQGLQFLARVLALTSLSAVFLAGSCCPEMEMFSCLENRAYCASRGRQT